MGKRYAGHALGLVLTALLGWGLILPVSAAVPSGNQYLGSSTDDLAEIVKFSGCTFDGLLDGAAGLEAAPPDAQTGRLLLFDAYVDLISRSNCTYINRAVETWDHAPDFPVIARNIAALRQRLNRPVVLGEFIAESVPLNKPHISSTEPRAFDFNKMCRADLQHAAKHCYGSFDQPEYQQYVAYIIRKSIDLGIQVFLMGGSGLTDRFGTAEKSGLIKVIRDMRSYAAGKGIKILFIAQSPSVFGGPAYAANFDLIQGGAYIDPDGSLPGHPAVGNKGAGSAHAPPRIWLKKTAQGGPVYDPHKLVIEYDWFGNPSDDSSEIACLSAKSQVYLDAVRAQSPNDCPLARVVGSAVPATRAIYNYFRSMGAGFWLPGRQPIAFAPWFYTPLNHDLYERDRRFTVNFDDEAILSIGKASPK